MPRLFDLPRGGEARERPVEQPKPSRRSRWTRPLHGRAACPLLRARPDLRCPGPSDPAMRSRSQVASAGLVPEVETEIVTCPRRWTAGQQEGAIGGVVCAVHPDSGPFGVGRHRPVDLGDPCRGHDQPVAGGLARSVRAELDVEGSVLDRFDRAVRERACRAPRAPQEPPSSPQPGRREAT